MIDIIKVYSMVKLILIVSGIILIVFSIHLYFIAQRDYNWEEEYLRRKGNEWIVFTEEKVEPHPFYIYSLVTQPIKSIGMVNKKESRRIQKDIFYVEELWSKKEIGNGTVKEEKFKYLINCYTFETGWNKNFSNVNKHNIDLSKITWLNEQENNITLYKDICKILATND